MMNRSKEKRDVKVAFKAEGALKETATAEKEITLKNRLEISLLHFLQEILGDREAGGITYYGVGITEGTFGCRRLIREVILRICESQS